MNTKRKYDTIDLTQDDCEYSPIPGSGHQAFEGSVASLSQSERASWADQNEDGAADDIVISISDDDDNTVFSFQLYGAMGTKIVGVQYYRGLASPGEHVILRREPRNPYDSNAIKVENVRREQIGHIPRNVAAKLAKYLDQGLLTLEGCLSGSISTYDCPIELKLFGTSDPLARAELRTRLKEDRLPVHIIDQKEREAKKRKAEESKRIAAAKKHKAKMVGASQQGDYLSQTDFTNLASSQGDGVSSQSFEEIMDNAQTVNPRDMGKVVEKFGLDDHALASMPMADSPAKLSTNLLPYQRQAVSITICCCCRLAYIF